MGAKFARSRPLRRAIAYTDEADVFVVHCPETDRIYAVPVGESGVLKAASLRVTAPANGQMKGIRWAADHELPT